MKKIQREEAEARGQQNTEVDLKSTQMLPKDEKGQGKFSKLYK